MKKGEQPAFPSMDMNSHMGVDRMELRYVGLTKREYFAAMAMQGLILYFNTDAVSMNERLAERAVKAADELLKALES